MKVLVFGHKGWIASQLIDEFKKNGFDVILPPDNIRVDDIPVVNTLLDDLTPDCVICLLGRTHGPGYDTIDYLELPGKIVDNVRDNLFAPISLAIACRDRKIHYTYLGTGCIFSNGTETLDRTPYKEVDLPDFYGSSYSVVKGFTDRLMHQLADNTLNLRIRMPITGTDHQRNLISKLVKYKQICSISNSMSVLPTLLPLVCDMIKQRRIGTINLVNPGHIEHNEILDLYKLYVNPTITWENMTLDKQNTLLLSRRSNNVLDTTLLTEWYPNVPHIKDAVIECLKQIGVNSWNEDM